MKGTKQSPFPPAIGIDLGGTAFRSLIKSNKSIQIHYRSPSKSADRYSNMDVEANVDHREKALRQTHHKMNSDRSCLPSECLDATCALLVSGNRFSKQQSDEHPNPDVAHSSSNVQSSPIVSNQDGGQFQQHHNNP